MGKISIVRNPVLIHVSAFAKILKIVNNSEYVRVAELGQPKISRLMKEILILVTNVREMGAV